MLLIDAGISSTPTPLIDAGPVIAINDDIAKQNVPSNLQIFFIKTPPLNLVKSYYTACITRFEYISTNNHNLLIHIYLIKYLMISPFAVNK